MDLKIIYEDTDMLVVDKPAGIVVFHESGIKNHELRSKTLIDLLLEKYPKLGGVGHPPRYGIIHRLDKDTSGILLVAKNNESLIFLQKQFSAHTFYSIGKSWDETSPQRGGKNRETLEKTIEKRYIALATGVIKEQKGVIETLIGRSPADPRKQKAYSLDEPNKIGKRLAITEYKVLQRFTQLNPAEGGSAKPNLTGVQEYTLLEAQTKTGRKHQVRCHLAYIHHPIAGDKMYGFKDSPTPEGLDRQFLHAGYLKITLPRGQIKEFNSELPEELVKIIKNLKVIS